MHQNYWLFKAEPELYGIDHLAAAPAQTGRWDGIRNYQARNLLRDQVQTGDLVLIYHSSCRQLGLYGVAQVVRSAYPDPSQFDPASRYLDPKASPEAPRWVSVDIQLLRQFDPFIALAELKAEPELSQLCLFRQPRLSIQPVSAEEWAHIQHLRGLE